MRTFEGRGGWHALLVEERAYVADTSIGPAAVVAVHREAPLVLRPRLVAVEIDPTPPPWPSQVSRHVQVLHGIAERQGRWPPRNRPFASTGIDLDPDDDAEFEVLVALSPHTLLADGYDQDGRNVYSATDEGGLWLSLRAEEHDAVVGRLSEAGVGDVLKRQ
jgi:hypothetical protein